MKSLEAYIRSMRPEIRAIIFSYFDYEKYAADILKISHEGIQISSMKYLEISTYYSKVQEWTLPSEIRYLTNLLELNLSSSNLSGKIDTSIFELTSLKVLRLNNNHLIGSIPKEIFKLVNLFYLDLSHNSLSGVLPSELWNLNNAHMIYLQSNNFQGLIPDVPPQRMQSLMRLFVNNNQIIGFFGEGLSQMPSLQLLRFDNNAIRHVPVLRSTSLHWVHLDGNPLDGAII